MKRTVTSNRTWLVPLWAGLLLLGGPVLSGAADQGVGELRVQLDGGLVSVTATEVPLEVVVREIAVKADLRLIQHVVLDRPVSLSIDRQALPDVLDRLLANDSYQLYRRAVGDGGADSGASIPGMLWIFAEGAAPAPEAMLFFEGVILKGTVGQKKEAIRELRRVATIAAVQTLSVALGDDDERVRKAAMEALSAIGGDEALAAIASASADDDPHLRARAAQALSAAGGRSAADYLALALHDEDPRVRAAAVASLGDLEDDRHLHIIRQSLDDPDPQVRERAVDILEDLDDEAMFRALFPPE
jgi:HEAT repeat protein